MILRIVLLITFLLLTNSVHAQNGLNKYQKKANYDTTFVAICAQLEGQLAEEKLKFIEGGELDNAYVKFKRWEHYWRDRLEGEYLPNPKLIEKTYQDGRAYLNENLNRDFASVWEYLGPTQNTGGYWGMGRVTDIDFHPEEEEVFFVGAAKGGIWKTTNGGDSYFSIGDDLVYNSVGNICVNKENPDEIYITLGDRTGWWAHGIGVYKTTDGGLNWEPTGLTHSFSDEVAYLDMQMSPHTENLIFVATGEGLYRSEDGFNFEEAFGGLPGSNYGNRYPRQVLFHPTDPNIVYVSWFDSNGGSGDVYKSSDAGLTWSNATEFSFNTECVIEMAVTPINPARLVLKVVAGSNRFIAVSLDNGETFTEQGIVEDLEDSPMCISPSYEDVIYSGYFYVRKSEDDGQNFTDIAGWDVNGDVHVDHWVIKVNPLNQKMYWGNDGGVYEYIEWEDQWTEKTNELAITQVYRVAVSQNVNNAILFGTQDNGGGFIYNGWKHANGGDAMSNAINPLDSDISYSTYPLGIEFYRTYDGWNSTEKIENNIPDYSGNADWMSPFAMNFNQPEQLVAASSEIYITYNEGTDWEQITDGETNNQEILDITFSPSNDESIYACYANHIIETNDLEDWEVHDLDGVSRVLAHPTNKNRVWAISNGYSEGNKVFYSKNRGEDFTNISGDLPNIVMYSLAYDEESDMLYLGTEVGIFATDADEDDIDWQAFGVGLPYTQVFDIDIQENTRKLVIATFGRGLWQIDIDETEEEINTSSANLKEVSCTIYPNPAEDQVVIEIPAKNEAYQLKIYNQLGQLIQEETLSKVESIIDITSLKKGMYLLHISNENNQLITHQKMMKN